MIEIKNFNREHLGDATSLLYKTQKIVLGELKIIPYLTLDKCLKIIEDELKKEVSSSYMLFHDERLVGYIIATIKKDPVWGNKGWINLGACVIEDDYVDQLGFLYEKIAAEWVEQKIFQHYFVVYASLRNKIDTMNELGFAKEQTYGIMKLDRASGIYPETERPDLTVRLAEKKDQKQISGFSRIIALFQSKSPCFAASPEQYLNGLDEGFSDLTEDEEGILYVVEIDGKILGFQLYYRSESASLLEPENSVELAVSAISEDARGKGAGYKLTSHALNDFKKNGNELFTTDWRCANLLSSRFWPKIGFKPLAYRLVRSVDQSI